MAQEVEELPGYHRGERIHDSSASSVYRARRVSDGASVVIKRSCGNTVSATQLTRYRTEFALLGSIACQGVVKVHELVRHERTIALVLEDVPGISLRRWIETQVAANIEERLQIAVKLASILRDVHAAGIVHKDVSSHNVVYDSESRRCKLIDFGLATRLRSEARTLQAPAALEGTLAYIAPEQTGRMNRSLDYRADLYSLGVTLYELLTGALPHESADPLEMVHFHIAGTPRPPHERVANFPEPLSAIVMKLLQKEPENRYQSATGVVADLNTCLTALAASGVIVPFPLAAEDAIDRFDLPQKLYGRAAETRALLQSFERVAHGSVEAVMVSGQPGIGKTALVQEIHQAIALRRGYFVAGKFDQLQQNVPFSALVAAFQDLVQQLLTESEEAIASWRSVIHDAVHPNGQLIVDVVPALELIIGPQPRVPDLAAFEAKNRFNLVFRTFVQVFCRSAHPLVLFLDDMQWADPASLNLMTLMVSARATESLLLVMTYRDNEVSAAHPFILATKELAKQDVQIHSIDLRALGASDVAQFVADALRQEIAAVMPLAEIVHQKTAGNPFFMRQFMLALYDSKVIHFDPKNRAFRFDPTAVKNAPITENVAEFLAERLDNLPPDIRDVLRVAAAIGNRFELNVLARVQGRSVAETAERLKDAIDEGLIAPLSGLESLDPLALQSPLVYSRFAFLHDRVKQAAYATLTDDERAELHLAIGRVQLAQSSAAQLESQLFDIVNHLNRGSALIGDRDEQRRLAELNLRAGAKARDSTAYDLAVRCFRKAVDLLGARAWRECYELQADAHRRLAETLCITDVAATFEVINRALEHAKSLIDRAKLYTLEVGTLITIGRMPEALAIGRRAARLFEVELPEESERVRAMLMSESAGILEHTAAIGVDKLLELPVMEDEGKSVLMGLLAHCLPAAYTTEQDAYGLICCKMIRLSLEWGNSPFSARGYGSFAAILSGTPARYEDAYRFAKLGVDLCHKLNAPSVLPAAYFLWALFSSHWIKPIAESAELFRRSVESGLQSGDHQHASLSANRRISNLLFSGMPLPELREEANATMELLQRIGDTNSMEYLRPQIQLLEWLRGDRCHGDTLGTDEHDEDECTAIIQGRGNRSVESDWFRQREIQRYFCGDFSTAYAFAQTTEELVPFCAAFFTTAQHTFFYSLIMTARYADASHAERETYHVRLAKNQQQMKTWAGHCPENFNHMYLLVEAERARIAGSRIEAADLYDRAIAAAHEQTVVGIEALAAELAARFWLDAGKRDFVRVYLEKALHAYDIWGAHRKIADLTLAYGLSGPVGIKTSITGGSTTASAGTQPDDSLDLATVLKATQAISGEIVLERLLATLMEIIVENAGAESAVLVLASGGQFLVQGVKNVSSPARVLMGEPLRQSTEVSKGIVNYVIRTSEHVVLADPLTQGKFRNDPYVRSRNPRSVLCAPVLHKGALTGVIYLENNQVAGAFTPHRLEALNILLSQIAVSIENATLYAQQEQQRHAIESANVTLTNEVAERKRAEAELSRYRDGLEELVKARTRELENAQGRLVDLSRSAGMAEVASRVLHSVGNVMNSVNVGTSLARDAVKTLPIEGLGRTCDLFEQNADRLPEFLRSDPTGKKAVGYLRKLWFALADEKKRILTTIDQVAGHLEHMNKIIAAQQSYAMAKGVTEVCTLEETAETALSISDASVRASGIEIVREYEKMPAVLIDRHQVMQILVNLISNAKRALEEQGNSNGQLKIAIARVDGGVRIEVRDNGIGISRDHLAKIFNHGFTTKAKSSGFGLHDCANTAQQMDGSLTGHSDGPGTGASFVLRLPVEYVDELRQPVDVLTRGG